MCADQKLDPSLCRVGEHLPFLGRGQGSGQKTDPDSSFFQQGSQGPGMLFRQNFRGRHHGRLEPVLDHSERHAGGHGGFAAAHVPLNQAGHGRAALHIPDTVCHGAPLGSGRGKREQRPESRRRIPLDPGPGPAPGTALEPQKAKLEQEQLLEHQAAPRN